MQCKKIQIILHIEKKLKIMVISSSNINPKINPDIVKISPANTINLKRFTQNGQIQIYQSSYRGSYSSIIRDSLRNAALGRKVLLVQFMKGGVKQGVANAVKLCGNLTWVRSSHSFDQYHFEEIENNNNLKMLLLIQDISGWLLKFSNSQEIYDTCFWRIQPL